MASVAGQIVFCADQTSQRDVNSGENPRLPAGTVLRDYEINDVLGIGGFGITYLATHVYLHNKVAIKEYMPQEFARRTENMTIRPFSQPKQKEFFDYGLDRFLNEARDLVRFSHPNIIGASNYFEANGTAYIVMEYAHGYTLENWLSSLRNPPEEKALVDIFLPLLDGLREVHNHELLHRDIKPDNIYLQENGPPLLIDFGAARNALGTRSRSLGVVISHGYSPKEQYAAAGNQGAWTDIYSVGACIRRAISGQIPPESTIRADDMDNGEPDPLQPAVELFSDQFSKLFLETVDWCMALSSKNRPQSVIEVQNCLLGIPSSSKGVSVTGNKGNAKHRESRTGATSFFVDKSEKHRLSDNYQTNDVQPSQHAFSHATTQAGSGKKYVPALLALLVAGGLLGAAYFLQQHSSNDGKEVASSGASVDKQIALAANNNKKIKELNVLVSSAEIQSLQSDLDAAQRLESNNETQSASAKLAEVLDQQSTILAAYPRRFRTGSSRESKDKAYASCVQTIGEQNCARAWFETETQSRVDLIPFSLDAHEVTFEQFAVFADSQDYRSGAEERGWSLQLMSDLDVSTLSGYSWRKPEGADGADYQQFLEHPVVHVSHKDAQAYCNAEDARLPTRAEWEYAMSGQQAEEYASYFDGSSVGQLVDVPKVNSQPAKSDALLDTRTQLFGGTGNVWEWTNTPDLSGGSRRLLKGGSWNENTSAFMRFAALRPEYQGDSFIDVGFRCARDLARWPEIRR